MSEVEMALKYEDKIYTLVKNEANGPGEACRGLCDVRDTPLCDVCVKGFSCSTMAELLYVRSVYLKEVK